MDSHGVPFVDFKRQYAGLRDEILAAITQTCDAQQFILGPQVAEFERAAAKACGAAEGIGCSSGTDALWLALVAAGVGSGDSVITSPFTFFASVSAILRAGAKPLLADINPDTYNLDPAAVSQVIASQGGRVRAVMPIHLYGQCADMDAFAAIQRESGALMIEDAAQAFGAEWHGRRAGSLGDAAAFSFYPTKNLSAMGDAGLVTTNNAAIAERARALRTHGMRRRYYHDEIGWNCRLDSIQAAVLSVKLAHVDAWTAARQQRAAIYDQMLTSAGIAISRDDSDRGTAGVVLPITAKGATHVFHQYVVRVGGGKRDALRDFLAARKIGTEIYYPLPLHLQQSLAHLGYKDGDFPFSERAATEVLALPIYPELTHAEQETVVAAVSAFFAQPR
jgi:dTDP-4-amino-4,6-dideoxygalactose transaminase